MVGLGFFFLIKQLPYYPYGSYLLRIFKSYKRPLEDESFLQYFKTLIQSLFESLQRWKAPYLLFKCIKLLTSSAY